MNRKNMQRLLDFYEAGAPEFKLEMHRGLTLVTHDNMPVPQLCGSAGCIAGSAYLMSLEALPEKEQKSICATDMHHKASNGQLELDYQRIRKRALAFLGLPWVVSFGNDWIGHPLFNPTIAPYGCTAQQAAQAIRNVMDGNHKDPWVGVRSFEPEYDAS